MGVDKQSLDNSSMLELESHFMADDHLDKASGANMRKASPPFDHIDYVGENIVSNDEFHDAFDSLDINTFREFQSRHAKQMKQQMHGKMMMGIAVKKAGSPRLHQREESNNQDL